jgi:hypothetical protein
MGNHDATEIELPRFLAVWALLAYAGLTAFFTLMRAILPEDASALFAFSWAPDFVTLPTMAAPALAVLLAARVAPAVSGARLAVLVALIVYAAVLVLGAADFVVSLVVAFIPSFDGARPGARSVHDLGDLIVGVAELVLVAVAALWARGVYADLGGRLPGRRKRKRSRPPAGP